MSGALVPYHQRQNKAVDRHLFIDLLALVNRYKPISGYTYISFGGAFLEDFKLLHSQFGNVQLISLENDPVAWGRQQFNQPISCIQCVRQDSSTFITNYSISGNAIFWLDFADAKRTRQQIEEFQSLLGKMQAYDIVKLTLNANPNVLRDSHSTDEDDRRETSDVRNEKRLSELRRRLGEFIPQDTTSQSMTADALPGVLLRAVQYAANEAMKLKQLLKETFYPLTAFAYNDSQHQMLTVTGIILPKQEVKKFLEETGVGKWNLASRSSTPYQRIRVPSLSAREKIFIDRLLPKATSKQIQKKLGFLFDKDNVESIKIIDNYKLFYRYYPNFHKVSF